MEQRCCAMGTIVAGWLCHVVEVYKVSRTPGDIRSAERLIPAEIWVLQVNRTSWY